MAKVNSDGSFSGKFGNNVYYTRNGVSMVRAYNPTNSSRTPLQVKQRARFKAANTFLKPFKKVINIGYQGCKPGLSPMNEAVSRNVNYAFIETTPPDCEEPVFEPVIEKIVLSRGLINFPIILSCTRSGNMLSLTWADQLGDYSNRWYDNMLLVAYIPGKPVFIDYSLGDRETGSGSSTLPAELSGQVHVWVFYNNPRKTTRENKQFVSDSVYLGVF